VANPAYAKVYPWENVDQQAREAEWRHYGGALGDGVVGAPRADGSRGRPAPTGYSCP
jgi:hypothetical protein